MMGNYSRANKRCCVAHWPRAKNAEYWLPKLSVPCDQRGNATI